MPVSRLDKVYRKILLSKFFTRGWGSPDNLARLFKFRKIVSNRETCFKLVPSDYPITILSEQSWNDCKILEGKFDSPLANYLPEVVPNEVKTAYFQVILPKQWKYSSARPVCIHLAGTGDHYFWRRRNVMAKPLLKAGIGAIILENPFYGYRKPKDQIRSSLHNVSDIFVMGGCLILECLALLHWCEKMGFGPLGVSGLSMGGHMASLAATNWPKPLVLVPCLSWSTASSVFTEGVMSEAIDWELLEEQFRTNSRYSEELSKMCKILSNPFRDIELTPIRNISKESLTPYELLSFLHTAKANYSGFENKATKENLVWNLVPSRDLNELKSFIHVQVPESLSRSNKWEKEAIWFMKGMMDECTHLKNFSVPFDTSLIIALCAISDGYVPREGCSKLEDIWPGATVRYLNTGHVGAYIWYLKEFRKAIVEAFEKAIIKMAAKIDLL
ncbi:protein ABHD18 [Agrilus planipennis]|uniref:Protein ABHD18 n=1 Tax=Agrilus planipennis TaxID=224129 RepID=A0A7F5R3F1_AGRPL|nr:protein ABHD18 [Agrilus planipennis]